MTDAKRIVRRGPPGVRCPSCNKLAGNADEGEVEDYNVEADGNGEQCTVTVTATLYMTTACCGEQFKSYALEGEYEIDHECDVMQEYERARTEWQAHVADTSIEHGCEGEPGEPTADGDCQVGSDIYDSLHALAEQVDDKETYWTVEEEGEPQAYERGDTPPTDPKTGKPKYVNPRFRRTYRGITTTVSAKHELCEQVEEIDVPEGNIEVGAGDFEALN